MNLWAIVGGFAAALLVVWFSFSTGKDMGLAEGERLRAVAVAAKTTEMAVLEETHSKELETFRLKLISSEKQAHEKISKLLAANIELKSWWDGSIPAPLAEYAWGMHDDTGDSTLPSGPSPIIESNAGPTAH